MAGNLTKYSQIPTINFVGSIYDPVEENNGVEQD